MADKFTNSLNASTQSSTKLYGALGKLKSGASGLEKAIAGVTKSMKTLFAVTAGAGVFGKMAHDAASFNKQLWDTSRTAKVTGQSYSAMRRAIDDVNKSTHLTKAESSSFFKTLQNGQRGIRLNAKETGELAKVLSREYGPALSDVSEGLKDLMSLQQREIHLLRKVQSGMDEGQLKSYGAALIVLHGASEKEIETLIRTNRAYRDKAKAMKDPNSELRKSADNIKDATKASQDMMLSFGQGMTGTLEVLAKTIGSISKELTVLSKNPAFKYFAGAGAAVGIAVAGKSILSGGAAALGGIKSMFTPGGSSRGKGGGSLTGVMGGRGQSISHPLYVTIVGSSGAGGGLGGDSIAEKRRKGSRGARSRAVGRGRFFRGKGRFGGVGKIIGGGGRMLGRMGRTLMGGGGAGIIASLGAGVVGNALTSSGHKRTGAGVSAAGTVAGYAGTGAMIGSILPGFGTAIGAAAGGLLGLFMASDNLKTAFGENKEQLKKAKEEAAKKADDKKYGEVRQGLAKRARVDVGDKERLFVAGMRDEVAKSIATKQAKSRGLTGDVAKTYIEQSVKDSHAGLAPVLAAAVTEALKNKGTRAEAIKSSASKYGIKSPGAKAIAGVEKEFEGENQLRVFAQIRGEYAQIKAYTDQIVAGNDVLAQVTFQFTGNLEKAKQYDAESLAALNQKKSDLGIIEKKLKALQSGQKLDTKNRQQLETLLKKQGMGEQKIKEITTDRFATLAAIKNVSAEIAGIQIEEQKIRFKSIDRLEKMTDLEELKASKIKAQMELSKALYLGMGPQVDLQLKHAEQLEKARQSVLLTVKATKEKAAAELAGPDGKVSYDTKKRLVALDVKQLNLKREQLEVTKNLRESYLSSMQAFTNVSGAFSKIILSREAGVGKIFDEFKAPGGFQLGAKGAGMSQPTVRQHAGGKISYPSGAQFHAAAKRYDPDYLGPPPPSTRVNRAAASRDSGSESINRATDLREQTGIRPGSPLFDGTRFSQGGIVGGTGSGDKVPAMLEPGELVIPKRQVKGYKHGGLIGTGSSISNDGKTVTVQLDKIIKLDMEILGAIKGASKKSSNDRKKISNDKAASDRRQNVAKQSEKRKAVGETQGERRQQKFEDKLFADQKKWDKYTKKTHTLDKIMKPVNTSMAGLGGRGGAKGVDQQVKATYAEPKGGAKGKGKPRILAGATQRKLEKEMAARQTEADKISFMGKKTIASAEARQENARINTNNAQMAIGAAQEARGRIQAPASVQGLHGRGSEAVSIEKDQTERDERRRQIAKRIRVEKSTIASTQLSMKQQNEGTVKGKGMGVGAGISSVLSLFSAAPKIGGRPSPGPGAGETFDNSLNSAQNAAAHYITKGSKKGDKLNEYEGMLGNAAKARIGMLKKELAGLDLLDSKDAARMLRLEVENEVKEKSYNKGIKAYKENIKNADVQIQKSVDFAKLKKDEYGKSEQSTKDIRLGVKERASYAMEKVDQAREKVDAEKARRGIFVNKDGKRTKVSGPDMPQKKAGIYQDGKLVKELVKTTKEQAKTGKQQLAAQEKTAKSTEEAKKTQSAARGRGQAGGSLGKLSFEQAVVSQIRSAMAHGATGGWVGGPGGIDNVPAMLTAGEYVVNAGAARKHSGILNSINGYAAGGPVLPPSSMASGGGGGGPKFNINVRGDSVNSIMGSVQGQLASVLNNMMASTGTSGRFQDLTQSG